MRTPAGLSVRLDQRTCVRYNGCRCGSGQDRDRRAISELADLRIASERFQPGPAAPLSGAQIREELIGCRQLIDRLELFFSARVAELARCEEYEWQGHQSPTGWNALVVGEQSDRLQQSTQALIAGEISYPHPRLRQCSRTYQPLVTASGLAVDESASGAAVRPTFQDEAVGDSQDRNAQPWPERADFVADLPGRRACDDRSDRECHEHEAAANP